MKRILSTLAAAVVLAVTVTHAHAQSYPNRPIKILQGFAPGGNADTIARVIGVELTKSLGQPIVVEARAGAGGNLASDAVAKSPPDGYTLLLMTGGHTVSGALYKTLPFEPADSFEMVSTITQFPFLFTVRSDSPYQNLRSLIDAAKAKPESVAYGTAGIGSTHHLTGELLAKMAGANFLHVPYKGDAAAITSLLGGEIPLVVATPTVAVAQVKAGKLKVVATSGGLLLGARTGGDPAGAAPSGSTLRGTWIDPSEISVPELHIGWAVLPLSARSSTWCFSASFSRLFARSRVSHVLRASDLLPHLAGRYVGKLKRHIAYRQRGHELGHLQD